MQKRQEDEHIFVVDLNSFVKIRKGSRYEDLLWSVCDARIHAYERAKTIIPGMKKRNESSSNYVYYFTSPKIASKYFGTKYTDGSCDFFYERRDHLLSQVGIHGGGSDWWHHPTFENKSTSTSTSIEYNVIMKDFKMIKM